MNVTFVVNNTSKYISSMEFKSRNIHSTRYGIKSLTYLAPKIWSIIPADIKKETSLHSFTFKCRIKRWRPSKCPCRLCEIYVENLGFLNNPN